MKSFFLRLLVLAGIAVNVMFLLINLRPERPHLARHRRARILLRVDPQRASWVKENQLSEFAAAHNLQLEVITAKSFDEELAMLEAERDHPTGIVLAGISEGISEELREKRAIAPLQDFIAPALLDEALGDYIVESASHSRGKDGKIWFIPKRAEVTIAVYLTPAVEDVYLHWEADRAGIESALAEANGVGLPLGYAFEKVPDDWSTYDLFVAAWYWAHHPAPWSGSAPGEGGAKVQPRVAFRTGPNEDAAVDLIGSFFRHGLTARELGRTDAPAVLDALQWDALFRRHHLLAAACESEKGINSDGVNDLFKERRLAWAPINQEDSLWLHGGSQRTAEPGMKGSSTLSWAMLPAGASLELNQGKIARAGRTYSFREFHFWALPVHSPDPQLAFDLARFVTQRGLQQRETEAQGLLPVRQDLRQDYPILFRLEWMQRILDASYHQIDAGSGAIPPAVAASGYDDLYSALRASVVTRVAEGAPTLAAVQAAVADASKSKDLPKEPPKELPKEPPKDIPNATPKDIATDKPKQEDAAHGH